MTPVSVTLLTVCARWRLFLQTMFRIFSMNFYATFPANFIPVAKYFESNYIRGVRAVGRRRAIKVRYDPALWNQYDSVLQGNARTNNASEGWHNRFRILVGRSHPGLYSFLKDLQKEQADVEYMLRDLRLGKKIKNMPKNKFVEKETRISNIVRRYDAYVNSERELEYLDTVGCYINM